jgi:FkbM family methyltransferase
MPGDVVLDVGANIGYFSLLASQLVGPAGKVISIEASPKIHALLSENIAMNGITNVRAVNLAAAYEEGEMSIYAADDANIGSSSTIPVEGNTRTGTVKAMSLHAIATPDELARVRLIKIDIEGAEQPVVRSIMENLALYSPDCEIALEIAVGGDAILSEMAAHGFKAYELYNDNSDEGYIGRTAYDPVPFNGTVSKVTDFIFSRTKPAGR